MPVAGGRGFRRRPRRCSSGPGERGRARRRERACLGTRVHASAWRMYCYSCYRLHGGNTVRSDHRVVSRPRARFAWGLFTSASDDIARPATACAQQLLWYCCGVSFLAPFASGTRPRDLRPRRPGARPLSPSGRALFSSSLIPGSSVAARARRRYALGESSRRGTAMATRYSYGNYLRTAAQKGRQAMAKATTKIRSGT